jgi:hypothetical protein
MTTLEAQHEVITDLILENQKLKQERDELQKAINGLCEHLGVSPANTTLLAVEVLKIKRERDEAREKYDLEATEHMLAINKICNERDKIREVLMVIEDRCVDCEDACDEIQKIRDIAREALEK